MPPFNGLFRTDCVVVPLRTERWGKHPTNAVGRLDPAGKHNSRKGDADG